VGKAHFARAAATRLLADAAGPPFDVQGVETPEDHPIAKLIEAGSHPDMRWLQRLPKEKGEGIARNISVKQIRELGEFMGLTAALSPWRTVVVDSVDDLEREGANALLKMLEEPPPNTIFFLVSHAPGRLLPTIRSRCRRMDFQTLDDAAMTSVLEQVLPEVPAKEREKLVRLSDGSAGRALAFAEMYITTLYDYARVILREGYPNKLSRS
jgi:DNA polymerase-3 subunit delta'